MAAFRRRLLVLAIVLAALCLASDTATPVFPAVVAGVDTNLLLPFVANPGGFDTGLWISNTTRDDKGTTAQAGACTLYYFGSTTGGGAAPPQQTSAVVPAGHLG